MDLRTIEEYRLEASSVGVEKTVASARQLDAANDALVVSSAKVERQMLSVERRLEATARRYDQAYRQAQELARAQATLDRAAQQGLSGTSAYQRAVEGVARAQQALAAASTRAGAANDNAARMNAQLGRSFTNLGFQVNDIATSLASGSSPLQVLAQQGGQVYQALSEGPGGVGGTLKALGSRLAQIATAARVAGGALALMTVGAALSLNSFLNQQAAINGALGGLGRNIGLTAAQFDLLAQRAAAAGDVSVRQATDIGVALARTGRLGGDNIERLIGLSKNLAATFGTDLDGARQMLVQLFSDPQRGIERLDDQLGFLDGATRKYIDTLFAQGRAQEAIRTALDKLPGALSSSTQSTGFFSRTWDALTTAVSNADLAVGRFLDRLTKGPDPKPRVQQLAEEFRRLQEIERSQARTEESPGGAVFTTPVRVGNRGVRIAPEQQRRQQEQADAYYNAIEDQRRAQQLKALPQASTFQALSDRGLTTELADQARRLREIVEELPRGSSEYGKYKASLDAVNEALRSNNPALRQAMANSTDLTRAQEILTNVVRSQTDARGRYVDAETRATQIEQLQIRLVQTRNVEDRARLQAQITLLQNAGQMITSVRAEAAAENAATQVREQAAAQLRDMVRGQEDEMRVLQEQIAALGQNTGERERAVAMRRAEQDLVRAGLDPASREGQQYVANAGALSDLGRAYDQAREAQQKLQEGQRQLAQDFSSFVGELITGSGDLSTAFQNLGKSYTNNVLKALLTGEGPMAGLLGTAPTERGGVGGLLGGNLGTLFSNDNLRQLTTAIKTGAKDGFVEGLSTPLDVRSDAQKSGQGGSSSGALGSAGQALVGLAAAYGAGRGTTNTGQALLGGGLSGLGSGAGLSALLGVSGPIGAGIGVLLGAGLSLFGNQQAKQQQKKQERLQNLAAYEQAKPEIAALRSSFRGEVDGSLTSNLREAAKRRTEAATLAYKAGDIGGIDAIDTDLAAYQRRVVGQFFDTFNAQLQDLTSGLGPNSPFAQARDQILEFGESLKGFVTDTSTAYSGDAVQIERAREASRAYALTVLDGAKELSTVQTRMQEIQGTANALARVLVDLGVSAADAGAAVSERVTKALDRLRGEFTADLERRINDATDRGYLNEVADLIKERDSLLKDAASLGVDPSGVTRLFQARAQEIVDGADLAGEALADLVRRFPDLAGAVVDAGTAVDKASKATEIAARRLGFADRLFNATNDNSTIEGQLAAFDRSALRERQDEIKAGGEALADLEAALNAERLNIIRDFNKQAQDAEKARLEEAVRFLDQFRRQIREYVDGLRAGSSSPLSPEARLQAAQSQYAAQLALAQGGNRDAVGGITQYASDLLDAARAFYASSPDFQTLFAQVTGQLEALPNQVSAEQFIVNAIDASKVAIVDATATMRTALQTALATTNPQGIAAALSTYFANLDANTDGLLTRGELESGLRNVGVAVESGRLAQIYSELDANGDGQLSRLELIRGATEGSKTNLDTVRASTSGTEILNQTQNALLNQISGLTATQNSLLDAVNTNTAADYSYAQALFANAWSPMTQSLAKINNNLVQQNIRNGIPYSLATGGYVEGPGTGTSDSIAARLSNGEYVLRAASVRQYGRSMLEAMNAGRLAMPALPVPIAMGGMNDNGTRQLITELKAEIADLKNEMKRNTMATVAGAQHVREGVDEGREARADARRARRQAAA